MAEPHTWSAPGVGIGVLLATVIVLAAWVLVERRVPAPLVDLRLLGAPSVLRANAAMLIAGVGMYLMFSLLTRFVQTPAGAGYGFALLGVAAGAALIPFSLLGFVAGKAMPALAERRTASLTYVAAAAAVAASAVVFALGTDSLVVVLIAMAVLGFGVGGVSAVMPRLVLEGVPPDETASVLTINQIVRSIGYSTGSAVAGVLLAAATTPGTLLPAEQGYVVAALWSIVPLAVSAVIVLARRRR